MRQLRLSLFVVVGLSVVLIKKEVGVGSGIDAQPSDILLFVCTFYRLAERKDRACTYEQWNGVDGRVGYDGLAALQSFICPVVVPIGTGGEIDGARGGSLFGDGGYKQRGAKHVLVAEVDDVGIVGEVHEEATHEGCSCLVSAVA